MADLYQQAKLKYPILAKTNYVIVKTPDDGSGRKLEHFPPGEPGSKEFARPNQIPMNKFGLQLMGAVSADDVAGDIISHNLVKTDPFLKSRYNKFKSAVPKETMRQRYQFHVKNRGEKRSFEDWSKMTGFPELMRGYVFNQFNFQSEDDARQFYGDKQFDLLNENKSYVTTAKKNSSATRKELVKGKPRLLFRKDE